MWLQAILFPPKQSTPTVLEPTGGAKYGLIQMIELQKGGGVFKILNTEKTLNYLSYVSRRNHKYHFLIFWVVDD